MHSAGEIEKHLAALDKLGRGECGAYLRQNGLYSSQIADWRRKRLAGLAVKRGPKAQAWAQGPAALRFMPLRAGEGPQLVLCWSVAARRDQRNFGTAGPIVLGVVGRGGGIADGAAIFGDVATWPGRPWDTLTWMLLMPDGSVAAVGSQHGSPEDLQRVQTRALMDIRRTCRVPAPGNIR